ncbi:MAG: hypothetical protein ACFFAH_16790 [Promethearchaeota archaeon]
MSEEGGSSLGIISLISALIASFLIILIVYIESILVGPLAMIILVAAYALVFLPIAILTGLIGIIKDNHRIYGLFGFFLGIFLILYFFFGNTSLFTWMPF